MQDVELYYIYFTTFTNNSRRIKQGGGVIVVPVAPGIGPLSVLGFLSKRTMRYASTIALHRVISYSVYYQYTDYRARISEEQAGVSL